MTRKLGMVAAGHPDTAEAAATILREGGNAFDAVLAAMSVACVAEPVLCSMGGGGFLLARPDGEKPRVYDFFAQTPLKHPAASNRDFYPVLCDFGTTQQEFHIGMASMAVPGLVKGLFDVADDLGRMEVRRIIEPALASARQGVALNRLQAYIFQVVGPIYMTTAGSRAIFASKKRPGELVSEGDVIANPDYADFLETLAIEGADLFYRGEIAEIVDRDCRAGGGTLGRPDLESYRLERRRPLEIVYGESRVFTNPPPSTGGILIAFALELLREAGMGGFSSGSAEHLGTLVHIMGLTNEARMQSRMHEASPEEAAVRLFDADLVAQYRDRVSRAPKAHRGTTHISVVDADGNAASLTLSNGEGCGYVVPGTGVMLNNMLGEEDINPHGFHAWPTDSRLSSMMAPSVILDGNDRVTALGSGGSNRIRTAILQVLVNMLDHGYDIADAVAAPRLHYERDLLNIEPGFDLGVVDGLKADYPDHKIWKELNLFFGGVHAVQADLAAGDFHGAGDPRRGGVSVSP